MRSVTRDRKRLVRHGLRALNPGISHSLASRLPYPEAGQDFGARAKAAAAELAFGKVVTVRTVDTDRYGRTVAVVLLPDGRTLNHELVRSGYAWFFRKYAPGDSTLSRLEAEAREGRRGLWAQKNPVPPWDWRRHVVPTAEVVGNRRSLVYHRHSCSNAPRVAGRNRVTFDSADAAVEAGYRPGQDCHK
jgi:micrococcal nuclease